MNNTEATSAIANDILAAKYFVTDIISALIHLHGMDCHCSVCDSITSAFIELNRADRDGLVTSAEKGENDEN